MEEIKEVIRTNKVHVIYCDKCKKLVGKSEEYDDGWYHPLIEEIPKIVFGGVYYQPQIGKAFCKDCRNAMIADIAHKLQILCDEVKI